MADTQARPRTWILATGLTVFIAAGIGFYFLSHSPTQEWRENKTAGAQVSDTRLTGEIESLCRDFEALYTQIGIIKDQELDPDPFLGWAPLERFLDPKGYRTARENSVVTDAEGESPWGTYERLFDPEGYRAHLRTQISGAHDPLGWVTRFNDPKGYADLERELQALRRQRSDWLQAAQPSLDRLDETLDYFPRRASFRIVLAEASREKQGAMPLEWRFRLEMAPERVELLRKLTECTRSSVQATVTLADSDDFTLYTATEKLRDLGGSASIIQGRVEIRKAAPTEPTRITVDFSPAGCVRAALASGPCQRDAV